MTRVIKKSSSRPPSQITEAVADPSDAWARALASTFVPDVLGPLERTAAMHAAAENQQPGRRRPLSKDRADVLLRRAFRAGKLTRRLVRLRPGKSVMAYTPVKD